MKKIVLLGASLNSGNKGVNALTRGQIKLLLDSYGIDIKIIILSYSVNEEVINKVAYKNKVISIREVPCQKKVSIQAYLFSKTFGENEINKIIKNSDMVWDISEGDSFSDIYGVKRFIQHCLIKKVSINEKVKLVIMPQTIGPFKRGWVRQIAKGILKKADYVFVRDEISKEVVEKDLALKRKVIYSPDMAFYMEPDKNISINKFIPSNEKVTVGINVSALLYSGGYSQDNMFDLKVDYKKLVDKIVEHFAKMDDVNVILIPHVMTDKLKVEDDFYVCEEISKNIGKKINKKIYVLDKYYREDELKAIISGCDFFIGSRMHACIGAVSTLVPTVPIAYSRKFIGIWQKLNLASCVADPRKQDEETIMKIVISNFSNRNKIKDILIEEIPKLKIEIQKVIDIVEEK